MKLLAFVQRAQLALFCAIIFLIPSNLFLKLPTFSPISPYVSGIVVDYLIPKLYLSDFPIFGLLVLWEIEYVLVRKTSTSTKSVSKNMFALVFLSIAFFFAHCAYGAVTNMPYISATLWFCMKFVEIGVFCAWIIEHKRLMQSSFIIWALLATVCFQSALALYQWQSHHELFGYWFLGELTLRVSPLIAKTKFAGEVRVLPYGTTTHPNVLAYVMVVYAVLAMRTAKRVGILALSVATVTTVLTQSLTAVTALIVFLGTYIATITQRATHTIAKLKTPILRAHTWIVFATLTIVLAIPTIVHMFPQTTNPSIDRRTTLQHIATCEFFTHPLFGVGLNQFTTHMERCGSVQTSVRFLQPVHNVALLWTAETGIVGIIFLILFSYIAHKMYSVNFQLFTLIALPVSLIFSLDHAMMTLQTGQLLFAIVVGFLAIKKEQK